MRKLSPEGKVLLDALLDSPDCSEIVGIVIGMALSQEPMPKLATNFWCFHALESELARAWVAGNKSMTQEEASVLAAATIQEDKKSELLLDRHRYWHDLHAKAEQIRRQHREVRETMSAEDLNALREDLRRRHG